MMRMVTMMMMMMVTMMMMRLGSEHLRDGWKYGLAVEL